MAQGNDDTEKKHSLLKSPSAFTTSMGRYLAEISNYPLLGRKEEQELAMRYKETGDREAARKLVTSNLRFVVKIANEYRNYGLNSAGFNPEG